VSIKDIFNRISNGERNPDRWVKIGDNWRDKKTAKKALKDMKRDGLVYKGSWDGK